MNRRFNRRSLIILIVILAAALLLITALFVINKVREPAITVDGEDVMKYAQDFDVSLEFLQLILKDYVVYTVADEYVFKPIDTRVAKNDYNYDYLSYDSGRKYYNDPAYPDICYGIDVSQYQGDINWSSVAADGIDFAMVRIGLRGYGSGKLLMDDKYKANLSGASAAGLDVGAYFFSQAITVAEAEEEAELVINALKGYDITFPVCFDMEDIYNAEARTDDLSVEEATEIAAAFCAKIEAAGYNAMIYGNTKWLAGRIELGELKEYPIWFAQYHAKPLLPYNFAIWQYTNNGSVAGINNSVDMDMCFDPKW